MGKRVLVGYATGTGYTTGVAEAIGSTLAERGYEVDVQRLDANPSATDYDACVIGSAVNGGAWRPEAMSWLASSAGALGARPVAEGFFLGKGPTAEDTSGFARWAFKAFGGTAEGDARDWDAIRAWAAGLEL